MDFQVLSDTATALTHDAVVLAVTDDGKLSKFAESIDKDTAKAARSAIKRGDMKGKAGSVLTLPITAGKHVCRVILVGAGKRDEFTRLSAARWLSSAANALKNLPVKTASIDLSGFESSALSARWLSAQAVRSLEEALYQFSEFKSKKPDAPILASITLLTTDASAADAITTAKATAVGVALARDLGNLPGNVCTPDYLAKQAKTLGKQYKKLSVDVLDEAQMEKLGMGSFLAVSIGSDEPPRLITMTYRGGKDGDAPKVLVGKGITFDTGGISLKPGEAMDEMKFDMCGAASVFGVMVALAEMKAPINVIGVVAAAENMPGSGATRPGDIVTSLSGQTIEILNTDAEGRLVLCDALTYVEQFKPAVVIDIATLTGACVIALGAHPSGLFTNDDALAQALQSAGETSLDRVWRLPLWEDYQPQLDSNFADMQNIGGRPGGAITAACFLARFTKKYRWAHLDIAGTAWKSGKEKGATGRPVALLTEYLLSGQ